MERGGALVKEKMGFNVDGEFLLVNDNTVTDKIQPKASSILPLKTGQVIEYHIRVENSELRNYVAVMVPFAAGFEILNPELATSPPEAKPSGKLTRTPSYSFYGDDKVVFYYDSLPKGIYNFYFRVKASFEGNFSNPPARAELMYDTRYWGTSDGTFIEIKE